MTDRFIVTGTGRSGTGYVTTILKTLGIRVQHEGVWNWRTPKDADWRDLEGEVGWPAAMHLENFDGPIVHVVRDPLKVINSRIVQGWYRMDIAKNDLHVKLWDIVDGVIGLEGLSEWDQAAKHYVEWTKMIDRFTRVRFNVEALGLDDNLAALLKHIGHERPKHWRRFAAGAVPVTTNRHVREQQVSWPMLEERVSPELFADLTATAKYYSYL
jgi:hypothetical protein